MKVSIWDLDYYHAKEKVNCFNPDAMKISSYHKQMGDTVNFVTTEDDIRRPFDLYYIIKENNKTPNPPLDFFSNRKVKWWGKAFRIRVKWEMPDAMLGCRPDYLLYPEYNTQLERAEHVRFFNNNAELLPIYQDYSNSFKRKKIIVTDNCMWKSDSKSIVAALQRLEETNNLYFLNEIDIKKIVNDKDIKEQFLKLKFTPGVEFKWSLIKQHDFNKCLEFLLDLKARNPHTNVGSITVDYSDRKMTHWVSRQIAVKDFETIKSMIIKGKLNKIQVKVKLPEQQFETPYSYLFAVIGEWTQNKSYKKSWLEFLTAKFGISSGDESMFYWNRPYEWHEVFRDLLRQTFMDKEFLLHQWGDKTFPEIKIPWDTWREEFKYGI